MRFYQPLGWCRSKTMARRSSKEKKALIRKVNAAVHAWYDAHPRKNKLKKKKAHKKKARKGKRSRR